jgi:hypothetical protein
MILAQATTNAAHAAHTTLDKLKAVPPKFWLIIGGGCLAIVLLVTILRKIAHMNKIFVAIIVALVCALIGFNWIYARNEPKFLTPFVDKIAPWFPSNASAQPLKADPK